MSDTAAKRCSLCGQEKPLTDFYRCRTSKDGRAYRCQVCSVEWGRQYRRDHPQKTRASKLKSIYGISLDVYHDMVAAQASGCAICGSVPDKPYGLVIDHDHTTGQVRALLCNPCNGAIGLLGEQIGRLEVAIAYLQSHASDRSLSHG